MKKQNMAKGVSANSPTIFFRTLLNNRPLTRIFIPEFSNIEGAWL